MTDTMTMRDVAALAHVQRPVVSVWRRRSRATAHPFPEPCERRGGQELFRGDEVVAWLERTGRGNNPDARLDAASHSLLAADSALDADALSALLALRQLVRRPLASMSADELLDAADGADPDDQVLLRELDASVDLSGLAGVADALVEAAWSPLSAHRRLVADRLRVPGTNLAHTELSDAAQRFVRGIVGPLFAELGQPALMDATGCAIDVLAEVAAGLQASVLLMDGQAREHRLTRRQLVLAEVPYRTVVRGTRDWSVKGPTLHLVVLPAADQPGSSALDQLNLLDEIALQLDERQVVLCLAPAATLTDPLTGMALTKRDQLLREGYVRAIVRLPAGIRPAVAPEPSAFWLLGAADPAPAAERRTLVADLSSTPLPGLDGLADDLLAAWQGQEGARRRAWAWLHAVPTRDLISANSTLVPTRPQRVAALRSGADWVVRLRAADTAGRLAGLGLQVADGVAERVTLGQAVQRGWLRLIPGRRIDLGGLPAGSVPVIGETSLRATHPVVELVPLRTLDRLALLARADVPLTQPGDIVFVVRPRPLAVVDADGGHLVLAPARVLRLRADAPLLASTLAAAVNGATSKAWRTWTVATVPEPDRTALGEALAGLAVERARLAQQLAGLDALAADLITAVETRQLHLTKENHGPTTH